MECFELTKEMLATKVTTISTRGTAQQCAAFQAKMAVTPTSNGDPYFKLESTVLSGENQAPKLG